MDTLRLINHKLVRGDKAIEFQVSDWRVSNEKPPEIDETETKNKNDDNKKKYLPNVFNIKAYGTTRLGTSVAATISGFEPQFYIKIPSYFGEPEMNVLITIIRGKLPFLHRESITSYVIVKKINFWGFSNKKQRQFIEISFLNTQVMRAVEKILKKDINFPNISEPMKFQLFESNIPPLLRFFHIKKFKPAGWIRFEKYSIEERQNTQLSIRADWNDVKLPKKEKLIMAPFIICSYDIECDSSHGDFPLPKKDYLKLAQELVDFYYTNMYHTKSIKNNEEILIENITDAFYHARKMSILYTKENQKPEKQEIKVVSRKCALVLKMVENYKILAADIISNIPIININEYTILGIIEDAFCDFIDQKDHMNILKIFTKSNEKPTKKVIVTATKRIINIINKFNDYNKKEATYKTILLNFNEIFVLGKEANPEWVNDPLIPKVSMLANQISSVFNDLFPEIVVNKEVKVKRCNSILSQYLPDIEGDKVIQIGTAVQRYGEHEPFLKHIVTLGTCDKIKNTVVVPCKTEEELLLEWRDFIVKLDPDIITGYNIFGFDDNYNYERAKELGIEDDFMKISRISDLSCQLFEKKLASSALGDNTLRYIDMNGRINMDLLKVIQRDHTLESYKLDFVAETFMNDTILEVMDTDRLKLKIKNSKVLQLGNYVSILNNENEKINDGEKFKIVDINYTDDIIILDHSVVYDGTIKKWCLAKDDVSPQDIFRLQKENSASRAIIATYCIQDCVLVLHIINKLQILTNNIAMANTCSVPLSFIFLRGQGIKGFSLVAKECRELGYLIPVIGKEQDYDTNPNKKFEYGISNEDKPFLDDSYEGAIVLDPIPGIYLDKYVTVLDYASLYPSTMIENNLSHDSICLDKKYLGENGAKLLKKLGCTYKDVEYDNYKWKDSKLKTKGKYKDGKVLCRYVQPINNESAVIPTILKKLLKARKDTRAKIKTESDDFKKSVLDGEQLSYKITANSVYGLMGAITSSICMKEIAASTTAGGRRLLYLARDKTLERFEGAEIVYGDTDSIFINFNPRDENGNPLLGKEGLKKAIELGCEAEHYIQQFLEAPHRLEYEKTFYPFILFSKKRYLGNKYEFDVNKYEETSMGIVTKRRDNAKIVKHVYTRVKECLLNKKDLKLSIELLQKDLTELLAGKFKINMLTITKNLRGYYANPEQIAHKVLADRMAERDPGNKPQSNDRIPYVYIETKIPKGGRVLQGNRIEHPDYIKAHNLKPDYAFYITNQIMKPVGQIYSLIVKDLPGFNKGSDFYEKRYKYYFNKYDKNEQKTINKINDEKMDDVQKLIFGDILRMADNKKNKAREITDFFKIKK